MVIRDRVYKYFFLDITAVNLQSLPTLHQMNLMCSDLMSLYPMFSDVSSRYNSFVDFGWPSQFQNYAIKLARFGFFYKGNSLSVTCFQCGICLTNWELNNSSSSLETEIKINHAIRSVNCTLMFPLYKDETFYDEFMRYDVENHTTQLHTYLAATDGVNSERYKSYFTKRSVAAAAAGGGKAVSTRDKIKNDVLKENQQLELNNKKLKDLIEKLQQSNDKLCCICYTDERNVVTLPCSHLIVCIKCYIRTSTSLDTGTKNARCSYCRRKVGAYTVIIQP